MTVNTFRKACETAELDSLARQSKALIKGWKKLLGKDSYLMTYKCCVFLKTSFKLHKATKILHIFYSSREVPHGSD
jgi:hypothetical protein